ncbi:MAG: nuclear transport factor 2 family protein [Vicinamibacteria bacterium]
MNKAISGGDVTEELTQWSHRILDAIQRKDSAVLEEVLDESFVHISSQGQRQSKREFISAVTEATYSIEEIGFDWLRVESRGEVGVAVGIQRARGHLPDGMEFLSVGAFTDVFCRTDDGWRLWLAYSVERSE